MPKKTPKRTHRPTGCIVFPKSGAPYLNIEDIPGEKDKEELVVVKKLLGAITHYGGEHYKNPRNAKEDPFDIVCEHDDGRKVGIQVKGLVDKDIISVQTIRSSYKKQIETKHNDVLGRFAGCEIQIVDTGSKNYLPKFDKKAGQRIIKQLVDCLFELSSNIETLPVIKFRYKSLSIGPDNVKVGIYCIRHAIPENDASFSFEWTGGFVGTIEDRTILSDTVMKYMIKYAKPKDEFWLLTYTTDMPLTDKHPDIKRTREILDNSKHPFDIVWYVHPHHNEDRGHLIKVWPLDK